MATRTGSSSVPKSSLTLCDPMDFSTAGSPVLHYLPEFAQIHVHGARDANHLILCSSIRIKKRIKVTSVFTDEVKKSNETVCQSPSQLQE